MNIITKKLKQYNGTFKHLLIIDGNPLLITDSQQRMSECIQYVNGYDACINDGKIKRILNKYRTTSINIKTQKKVNDEKRKKSTT